MENLNFSTGILRIKVNEYGDVLLLDSSDLSIFNRFHALYTRLEELADNANREVEQVVEKYKEEEEVSIDMVHDYVSLTIRYSENVMQELNAILGVDFTAKVFRENYELNPDFVPDELVLTELIEALIPVMEKAYGERVKRNIAFWSAEKSKSDCTFENNPVIEINFTKPHTSSGLTFYFVEDYPAELKVTWYDIDGVKIIDKTFYPTKLTCVCVNQVENYGRVRIEFIKTSFPERYIKLQYILYGQYIAWQDDIVKTAKVQEEIDPTSATLSINTADISIIDQKNDLTLAMRKVHGSLSRRRRK